MKKSLATVLFILASGISCVPWPLAIAHAQAAPTASNLSYSGLVQCDGVLDPSEPNRDVVCNFASLMKMVKYVINWLFIMTIPIATALFAWAGLLYITGQEGKIKKAKSIFHNTAIGFGIMLIAWFAVVTVVGWFAKTGSGFDAFLGK